MAPIIFLKKGRQIMLILSEHFNDVCAKTSQLCKLPTWPAWPIITLHKRSLPHGVNKCTNHPSFSLKKSEKIFLASIFPD